MTYREVKRNPDEIIRPNYDDHFGIEDASGIGWVLIIGNDAETEVKIGYGATLNRYSTYCGNDEFGDSNVHLLAALRGTKQNESDIHTYFKAHNQNGRRRKTEFFKASEEVRDYIAFLRNQYYVAITPEETETARCIQPMSFELWRPSDQHRKTDRAQLDLITQFVPWSFFPDRSISTIMDDWYTPEAILDCARAALGGTIDLDPASHVVANDVVKAQKFYTEFEGPNRLGALELPWSGCVWLNPPFTKWKAFSQRIAKELDRGEIIKMVVLANSRTITAQYFEPVLARATAICVLQGRYSFWGNEKDGSPSNGQVIIFFSPEPNDGLRFQEAFSEIGITFHWVPKGFEVTCKSS